MAQLGFSPGAPSENESIIQNCLQPINRKTFLSEDGNNELDITVKDEENAEDEPNQLSFQLFVSPRETESAPRREPTSKASDHSGKRGPYRKYSSSEKRKAINLVLRTNDINKVALTLNIPIKNLRRWIIQGPERKQGKLRSQRSTVDGPSNGVQTKTVDSRLPEDEQSFTVSINDQIEGQGVLPVQR